LDVACRDIDILQQAVQDADIQQTSVQTGTNTLTDDANASDPVSPYQPVSMTHATQSIVYTPTPLAQLAAAQESDEVLVGEVGDDDEEDFLTPQPSADGVHQVPQYQVMRGRARGPPFQPRGAHHAGRRASPPSRTRDRSSHREPPRRQRRTVSLSSRDLDDYLRYLRRGEHRG